MLLEKLQLQLIQSPLPVEVTPGANAQQAGSAGSRGTSPKIQHTPQVGVMPPANQEHRPLPELLRRLVMPPALWPFWVALQPAQPHAHRVEALQQSQAVMQKGGVLEAAADLDPPLPIPLTLAALGGELQRPAQTQGPPMTAPLAGPMQPFIQAAHGRCQGIRQMLRTRDQQLAESLVGEAVGPYLSVAPGLLADPAQGCGAVTGLLLEAEELPLRIAAAADVLDENGEAPLGVPTGVGVGDG